MPVASVTGALPVYSLYLHIIILGWQRFPGQSQHSVAMLCVASQYLVEIFRHCKTINSHMILFYLQILIKNSRAQWLSWYSVTFWIKGLLVWGSLSAGSHCYVLEQRHFILCLFLVKSKKTGNHQNMTEIVFTGNCLQSIKTNLSKINLKLASHNYCRLLIMPAYILAQGWNLIWSHIIWFEKISYLI